MPKFEVIPLESQEYFDLYIEVGFAQPLTANQVTQVVQMITQVLAMDLAHDLYAGISFLHITENDLSLRLRYAAAKTDWSRAQMQFCFYLFAKIDHLYALAETPFPADWREWLNLPEHIAAFGYDDA